jgi:hypothetical protein
MAVVPVFAPGIPEPYDKESFVCHVSSSLTAQAQEQAQAKEEQQRQDGSTPQVIRD